MSNKEAARLILENIQMLDNATTVLNNVTEEIFAEIGSCLDQGVKEYFEDDWFGNYEWTEKNTFWFSPPIWRKGSDDSLLHFSWYEVKWLSKSESNGDEYWLTSLFPEGKEEVGILWNIGYQHFKETPKKIKWNAFAQEMKIKYPQLSQLGFTFNAKDSNWSITFQLDAKQVAASYVSDTLIDAFTPITDALHKLQKAHPYFLKIIEEAMQKFGGLDLEEEQKDLIIIN